MKNVKKAMIAKGMALAMMLQPLAIDTFADENQNVSEDNKIISSTTQVTTSPSALSVELDAVTNKTTPSAINVELENSTGTLNLTEQGNLDWAHFAQTDDYKDVQQHTITYEKLGETILGQMKDSPIAFSWSDGTPNTSQTALTTGKIHKQQVGGLPINGENGWKIAIGADDRKREATITFGGWQSSFNLGIFIDGKQEAAYVQEFTTKTTALNKKIKFYLSPGHSYEIKAVMTAVTHSNGNVTLSSTCVNEVIADKTDLKALVEILSGLEQDYYTADTWNTLNSTLVETKILLDDTKATQQEVDRMYTLIQEQMEGLQYIAGVDITSKLTGVIHDLKSVINGLEGYKFNTIENLKLALEKGDKALQDSSNVGKNQDLALANINKSLQSLALEGKYTDETNPGLTSSFGWEGDKHAPIAYIDGSYLLRDRDSTLIRFGVAGIPSKIKWENHSGYLPCFVSEYTKNSMVYTIENFADKVNINQNDYVICYSKMTTENKGTTIQLLPVVSKELMPLNEEAKNKLVIQPGEKIVREYAIAGDRFGNTALDWPTKNEIIAQGSLDQHFDSMKNYWDDKLNQVTLLEELPDSKLIDAYKAGYIYTMICKDKDELNVGENGYDKMYDHDMMGIVASLITMGDFQDITKYLDILPSNAQFEDSKWKFSWPFALYLSKTGDESYIRANFERIKANTHKITEDRVDNGKGIIKVTYSVDKWGQWTIDNWSALFGLTTYKYICDTLGETEESLWAAQEYASLLEAVNSTLDNTLKEYNIDYIPCSIKEPNEINPRCVDPRDANWASMFLFGRWAWDGYLFNAKQEGSNLERIDDTYAYGFDRQKALLPEYNFGGYPHGIYSSAYNAGYGSAALRGEKYRDVGIKAYQFMIQNSMSGPFGWWEGVDYPDVNSPWDIAHAKGGGGSCQHMWGQSVATKVLIDSLIAEKVSGEIIIGRGIPKEWITSGETIRINQYPITGNRKMGYDLKVSGKTINIHFKGDSPTGTISVELPILKNNIASVSTGKFDLSAGSICLPTGTKDVTIVLKDTQIPEITLEKPEIKSIEEENGKIKLSWNAIKGTEGYTIECALNGVIINKLSSQKNELLINKEDFYPDNEYSFRVQAYSQKVKSEKSDEIKYLIQLPVVTKDGKIQGIAQESEKVVNLTELGTNDWIRLGNNEGIALERKQDASEKIGLYLIGNKKVTKMKDSIVKFNWDNGTYEKTAKDTQYGAVFNPMSGDINAKGDLWMLTAPADTKERTLRIYVSSWAANATFKAYLSDNSAIPEIYKVESPSGSQYKVFEIRYKASSKNQALCVKSSVDKKFNGNGNTTLLAATLSGGSGKPDNTNTPPTNSSNKPSAPTQDMKPEQPVEKGNEKQIKLKDFNLEKTKPVNLVDIKGNFAENSINKLAQYGIVSGYPTQRFEPNKPITRGEIAAILSRIVNEKPVKADNFSDITGNQYYDESIGKIAALQLMFGYEDGTFRPSAQITRQEFAVVMSRLIQIEEETEKVVPSTIVAFKDNKDISIWAYKDLEKLQQIGIIKGDDKGFFNPNTKITRAETSAILERVLIYLKLIQ